MAAPIDEDSPDPPTEVQLLELTDRIRADHKLAAEARGLEGAVLLVMGLINASDPRGIPVVMNGPSQVEEGVLFQSTWQRGDSIPAVSDAGSWTVQNNLLIDVWQGKLGISVLTLIRPIKGIPDSTLPLIPEGFNVEPMDLREAPVDPIQVPELYHQGAAKYLCGLCADWGSWSCVPRSQFFKGMSSPGEMALAGASIRHFEERGYLRIEERGEQESVIHILPAFAQIFLRPPAEDLPS